MTEPVLTAHGLCVDRGGRRVLEDVTFSIEQGDVFALLGGNGAGKSTALLTFLGFIPPAGGDAYVQGLNVRQDIQAIRRQTAYLPESVSLYSHLSALENLQYVLSLSGLERTASELERGLGAERADWQRSPPPGSGNPHALYVQSRFGSQCSPPMQQ